MKRYIIRLLILFTYCSFIQSGLAQEVRELDPEQPEMRTHVGYYQSSYEESHALIIGNSAYEYLNPLPGVKSDLQELIPALEQHGFTVQVEIDLVESELNEVIVDFLQQHTIEDTRLLIYFAGHGETIKRGDKDVGYILPVDVTSDHLGVISKGLPMYQIVGWVEHEAAAKHVLLLFDSCFSGSVFNAIFRSPNTSYNTPIAQYISNPTRQFITSGSANQSVPDQSLFRRLFVAALNGEKGDLNGDKYITASELSSYLSDEMFSMVGEAQTPQYAKMNSFEYLNGDFVFALPGASLFTDEEGPQVALDQVLEVRDEAIALRTIADSLGAYKYVPTIRGRAISEFEFGERFLRDEKLDDAYVAFENAITLLDDIQTIVKGKKSEILEITEKFSDSFSREILSGKINPESAIFQNLNRAALETLNDLVSIEDVNKVDVGLRNWDYVEEKWLADLMVDIYYTHRRNKAVGLRHLYSLTFKKEEDTWIIIDFGLKDRSALSQ